MLTPSALQAQQQQQTSQHLYSDSEQEWQHVSLSQASSSASLAPMTTPRCDSPFVRLEDSAMISLPNTPGNSKPQTRSMSEPPDDAGEPSTTTAVPETQHERVSEPSIAKQKDESSAETADQPQPETIDEPANFAGGQETTTALTQSSAEDGSKSVSATAEATTADEKPDSSTALSVPHHQKPNTGFWRLLLSMPLLPAAAVLSVVLVVVASTFICTHTTSHAASCSKTTGKTATCSAVSAQT